MTLSPSDVILILMMLYSYPQQSTVIKIDTIKLVRYFERILRCQDVTNLINNQIQLEQMKPDSTPTISLTDDVIADMLKSPKELLGEDCSSFFSNFTKVNSLYDWEKFLEKARELTMTMLYYKYPDDFCETSHLSN